MRLVWVPLCAVQLISRYHTYPLYHDHRFAVVKGGSLGGVVDDASVGKRTPVPYNYTLFSLNFVRSPQAQVYFFQILVCKIYCNQPLFSATLFRSPRFQALITE